MTTRRNKRIPLAVKAKTVVRLRTSQGVLTNSRAIVMGSVKADAFSRAYGRQVYVCHVKGSRTDITEKGAHDVAPVGKAKHVPSKCYAALQAYKHTYSKE